MRRLEISFWSEICFLCIVHYSMYICKSVIENGMILNRTLTAVTIIFSTVHDKWDDRFDLQVKFSFLYSPYDVDDSGVLGLVLSPL